MTKRLARILREPANAVARLTGYLAFGLGLTLLGCGSEESSPGEEPPLADDSESSSDPSGDKEPQEYYGGQQSLSLGSSSNQVSCANCHSDDGSQSPYSGNTFQNLAYKTSYKGGAAPTLLDASNVCIQGWMAGTALSDADAEWRKLRMFLESVSDPAESDPNPLAPEVLEDEAAYEATYSGGDAAAGERKYGLYCASCHDGGLSVGNAPSPSRAALSARSIGRIAQQVRTSGPPPSGSLDASDSTPGPMPFFELRDLSQSDLQDIIAAIK